MSMVKSREVSVSPVKPDITAVVLHNNVPLKEELGSLLQK
jgi:hypothetical protein